jgi:transposase
LSDAPRSGAPRKLQAEHIPLLREWARQEALSALQLQDKLRARFDFKVSTRVVQQVLDREGFVWKRTATGSKKDATPLLAVPSATSKRSRRRPSEER